MKRKILIAVSVLIVLGAIGAGVLYAFWNDVVPIAGMAINYIRYRSAAPGTLTTELNPSYAGNATATSAPSAGTGDWPSYNKTLTSDRFSPLAQINPKNVGRLKILCTYDTGQYTGFTTGPIEVNGALIVTTEYDIFSLDPANCHENWRTHEDYQPAHPARRQPRCGLYGRQIVSRHPGRPRAGLRLQDRQTPLGDIDCGSRGRAKQCRQRRSPGTVSCLPAMPAATSKA